MGDKSAGHEVDTQLSPQQFYRNDPLLTLVRDRLHLGVGWCVVGIALLTAAVLLGIPALVRAPADQPGILISLFQSLLIHPTGVAIYLSLPDGLSRLFNSLKQNEVIGEARWPDTWSYAAFERKLVAGVNNRWWVVMAGVAVILYWVYRLGADVPGDATKLVPEQARPWLRLAILLVYSPVIYGALISLARFLMGLAFTRRLFRSFTTQINPLHPDGSAGLGAVGRMLAVSVLIATAIGAGAMAMIIVDLSAGRNPFARAETWVAGLMYLVALPLLFLGWLWEPRRAMLTAREESLRPWADEFKRSIPEAVPSSQDDTDKIKANTERLAEIKRQYELLQETYPVWPIRAPALNRLLATSLLPLITSLLSSLVPNIRDAVVALFGGGTP
jgi:hypothetical protein